MAGPSGKRSTGVNCKNFSENCRSRSCAFWRSAASLPCSPTLIKPRLRGFFPRVRKGITPLSARLPAGTSAWMRRVRRARTTKSSVPVKTESSRGLNTHNVLRSALGLADARVVSSLFAARQPGFFGAAGAGAADAIVIKYFWLNRVKNSSTPP